MNFNSGLKYLEFRQFLSRYFILSFQCLFIQTFLYFRLVIFSCPNLTELSGVRIPAFFFDFKAFIFVDLPVVPVATGAAAATALIMAPVIFCMFKDRSKQALYNSGKSAFAFLNFRSSSLSAIEISNSRTLSNRYAYFGFEILSLEKSAMFS